jgi:hypothetical protein
VNWKELWLGTGEIWLPVLIHCLTLSQWLNFFSFLRHQREWGLS